MNFKPTLLKIITSFIVGFILGFLISIRSFYGMGLNVHLLAIVWIISSTIVYAIWSLFQKK